MNKPFKTTRVGKILTSPIVKGLLTKIPLGLGSMASDFLNRNETMEGEMTKEKLVHNLVKITIYAVLVYLVFSGKLTWEDAEGAKSFITN